MSRLAKTIVGVVFLACAVALWLLSREPRTFGPISDVYQPSDELIYPIDVVQNPFKYKGHSGILDTPHVILSRGLGGNRAELAYPGGGLRFSKMVDEHTAVFEVLSYELSGVEENGELVVHLASNDPPEPTKQWRVLVLGTSEMVNELGTTVPVATVKFEGYAPQKVTPPASVEPIPQTSALQTPPKDAEHVSLPAQAEPEESNSNHIAAPIERRPPSDESKSYPDEPR